jgi:hypothetical protein
MRVFLRSFVEKIIYRLGFVVSRRTQRSDIEEFITTLMPKDVGVPLIRLGSSNDGGYLVPDDLNDILALFSPGVGSKWVFETDVLAYGITEIFACDPRHPGKGFPYAFEQVCLGSHTDSSKISLAQWVKDSTPWDNSSDLMLQMDIEGGEYEVILSSSSSLLSRFRIMVIEFHSLKRILDRHDFEFVFKPLMQKLMSQFIVVHIHPNNAGSLDRRSGFLIPDTMEFTFLRRDRIQTVKPVFHLPNVLDQDNDINSPGVELRYPWIPA